MSDWKVDEKWLKAAARFEGVIAAHRILKGDDGDDADQILWQIADEIKAEVDGE
ncbi:MAG TPA: hypothetical protein VIG24_10935 [Acidimicrobiia bacterium]